MRFIAIVILGVAWFVFLKGSSNAKNDEEAA